MQSFRIYDADLPEYAFSIDAFRRALDDALLIRVEEHRAGSGVDAERANRRFFDGLAIIPAVLDLPREYVFFKRTHQEKGAPTSATCWTNVREAEFEFEVDLGSQSTCGLPLDQRPVREMLRELARGKRFACLLAHGGAPTTYAAAGGATTTVTVDSGTMFLEQAERVVNANGYKGKMHSFICKDALDWVAAEAKASREYDLVYCDLSAFPASSEFKPVEDHEAIVGIVSQIMAPNGNLLLTCSSRNFKLAKRLFENPELSVKDVSAKTIGHDFSRTPKIHRAFLITKK